jgi:hypothetical protein
MSLYWFAGLDHFLQLFEDVRKMLTDLDYMGDTVVQASTGQPWAVPMQGRVAITVRILYRCEGTGLEDF